MTQQVYGSCKWASPLLVLSSRVSGKLCNKRGKISPYEGLVCTAVLYHCFRCIAKIEVWIKTCILFSVSSHLILCSSLLQNYQLCTTLNMCQHTIMPKFAYSLCIENRHGCKLSFMFVFWKLNICVTFFSVSRSTLYVIWTRWITPKYIIF